MPPFLSIDFSSAIDNARFFAARDEALRRETRPAGAARPPPGPWRALPKTGRPVPPATAAKSRPVPHAD